MQKKILTTFLIVFFTIVIFNINNVLGVGLVSQCWVNDVDNDGKQDLLFRTFVGPESTDAYHAKTSNELVVEDGITWTYQYNGKNYSSKWVYNKLDASDFEKPWINTFNSRGLFFHTKPMSSYTSNTNGTLWGYTSTNVNITEQLDSVENIIDSSTGVKGNSLPGKNASYDDKNTVFYEIERVTGKKYSINHTVFDYVLGGIKALKQIEWRYCYISTGGPNVKVMDNVVYNADLVNIIEKAKELNQTNGCYVSNLLMVKDSATATDPYYVDMRTSHEFIKTYTTEYRGWTNISRGTYDNLSLNSALNLYDNELIFPKLSQRTVLVRHINIGNNTVISENIVNNGSTIDSNNLTLNITKNDKNKVVTGKSTSAEGYTGYQEYYEGDIDIEQGIIKSPLNSTATYKALGYNVGVANTADGALSLVQTQIKNGQVTKFTDANKDVRIDGKDSEADSDYVVIDIYYTEYEKDVQVNHIYVDKDGYVLTTDKQSIQPNSTALINNDSVERINEEDYAVETYKKKLGSDVTVRIADSLKTEIDKGESLSYVGYEVFSKSTDLTNIVGTRRINLNSAKTVNISSDDAQVNFYYYLDNSKEAQEPIKTIGGKVFVLPTGDSNMTGKCNDGEANILVTTIPSGSEVIVGVDGIPRYMAGAITTEYVSENNQQTKDITLEYTLGDTKYTVSTNLMYKVGFYRITDMAIYKLTGVTVYDANSDEVGVAGEEMFNWPNNKTTVLPNNMNLDVQMYGINNSKIANTNTAIKNIENYTLIEILDKDGNKIASNNATFNLGEINLENTELTFKELAENLGLQIRITVQNMAVTVGNTVLTEANKVSKTYNLAEYMTNAQSIQTTKPEISTDVYSNIGMEKIKQTDYSNITAINTNVLNGVRVISGKANYEAQVIIGSNLVSDINDTVYYSNQNTEDKTVVFKLKNNTINKTYIINNSADTVEERYQDVERINIYTPITVTAEISTNSNQIVDQTQNIGVDITSIQTNTPFRVNFSNQDSDGIYGVNNTNEYSGGYYIKFGFDVNQVYINGNLYKKGDVIPAGTWIGVISKNKKGEAYLTAQPYANTDDDAIDTLSEEKGNFTVRAVAYNATAIMMDKSTKFARLEDMASETSDLRSLISNICTNTSYFAEKTYNLAIINRIYDFKVTDVKDINWKTVFRNTTTTNSHKGISYYVGTTKWNSKSAKTNNIISRTSSEIGRNPLRTLPIGPYKNTDTSYIKAPKLGYRFSFDMKVTGSYLDGNGDPIKSKKVEITTKFYYVSKDGKTYLKESDGTTEGILLFYKTGDGKYVKINQDGGGYELKFTPNDGYRYIESTSENNLSTKSLSLGNLRHITLTYDMATPSNNGFNITYYGEYKLPNSTIAVRVNKDGTYNINSPLKDGYIGVVFDIVAHSGTVSSGNATKDILLSYSKNTKANTSNTSQWDYEGFLGYTNYGNKVKDGTLSLKLEKGSWNITDKIYNEIKGSVILYDIDERAATDYE